MDREEGDTEGRWRQGAEILREKGVRKERGGNERRNGEGEATEEKREGRNMEDGQMERRRTEMGSRG